MTPNEIRTLLDQIASAKGKLFDAQIIRSERLTGEIGEYLAELQFRDAKRAGTTSNKGWDLILPDGNKVQVKAHAKGARNNARWTEVRHLDAFDILLIVVLSPDYRLRAMYQIGREELSKRVKIDSRKVATIGWDTLGETFKIAPNEHVKACFPAAGLSSDSGDAPDPGEDISGDDGWELLTGVDCAEIYFAPRVWRSWNVIANGPRGLTRGRKLVFEYCTPRVGHSAKNKISLRGLLPEVNGTLERNLGNAVRLAKWQTPSRTGQSNTTRSSAKWTVGDALADHHRAPDYPEHGFASESAFFNWLSSWDRLIGLRIPRATNTRLWEFIESVKP